MVKEIFVISENVLTDVLIPVKLIPSKELPISFNRSDVICRRICNKTYSGVIIKSAKED